MEENILIDKIANWIVYECDTPLEEVKWLLGKLYPNKHSQKKYLTEEYDGVLEYLKELDNPEYLKILEYLNKGDK